MGALLERDTQAAYPEVDPDFGHWLAGFIDGEGCFTIRRVDYGPDTWQSSYTCVLRLSLRDDDYAILAEIKRRTGLGLVNSRRKASRSHRPQAEWLVQRKADCARLVELLDRLPLRAKKARDYAIWREAVLECQGAKPGRAKFDWSRVAELKDELSAGRRYKER